MEESPCHLSVLQSLTDRNESHRLASDTNMPHDIGLPPLETEFDHQITERSGFYDSSISQSSHGT